MELRVLIVSLCVAHALEALPSERMVNLSQREIDNGTDRQSTEKIRDKRALGLLLSGLAQIFGYTVTPVQLASLPNPNTTSPAAMSNSSMMMMTMGMMPNKPQAAASRPANATMPRRQETLRFTGVVNFGNNSDIIGHLQRYEQIFHGRGNNTTMMSSPMPPMPMPPMPMPPAKLSLDLRSNEEKPPLLAPFFVKIPLPIAPELLPPTMPDIENLPLSYPPPAISLVSVPDEDAPVALPPQEPPVRKTPPLHEEEEMIYRNNENTERYMIQQKEIYDEKDVRKPDSKYNHQLYIDEPKWKQQQEERYNELQHNQKERVEKLREKEAERNREKNVHYNEDEMNEKNKNREEEIDNRNREHASKYESEEEEEPAYSDEKETENSAEEYEDHEGYANRPSGTLKQSSREDEREKVEDYPNYDDDDDDGEPKKQSHKQPENFDKYIVVGYNQQLPIGDYYHKDPEVIRDSYGEVLDNKNENKLADYVNMFKQPYFDTQNAHNPEDASREGEKSASVPDGYDEHLVRIQKLREEYGSPENKYEEYVIVSENDTNNDDKESERVQNHTPAKQRGSTTDHRGKEDDDAKSEKSQDEVDFVRYVPLVVPVRYVDVNDKTHQATTRQLNYKQSDKSANSEPVDDNVSVPTRSKVAPKAGLPERPRQLHDGEIDKQLQLWPSPFDYAFDTTEPVNTVVPPYPLNYYQPVVKTVAANDARNDYSSVEQPSGYLVVVGDPNQRYPHNVYYFPNEAVDQQNRELYSNIEDTQNQIYVPQQQTVNQQFVQQSNPNLTRYNLNETATSSQNYYHQSQEVPVNVLHRYEYISGYAPRAEESSNIGARPQLVDINNWSNKIHRGDTDEQNVASSNQNAQRILSERPLNIPRRRRSSQQDDRDKNEDKKKEDTTSRQPIPENKPFDDPESAHDFFGFNKDDYSFEGERSDALEVEEKDGKIATELPTVPEPITYHHDDESMMKDSDELENDPEKAEVTEYRNKVATLKVSEQRQLEPNGPIQYVNYIRNI